MSGILRCKSCLPTCNPLQACSTAAQTEGPDSLDVLELTVARALRSSLAAVLQAAAAALLQQRERLTASLASLSSQPSSRIDAATSSKPEQPGWDVLSAVCSAGTQQLGADQLQDGVQALARWGVAASQALQAAQQRHQAACSAMQGLQRLCQQQAAELQRMQVYTWLLVSCLSWSAHTPCACRLAGARLCRSSPPPRPTS